TGQSSGQGGAHRAQLTGQGQLSEKFVAAELGRGNLAGGGENTEGNGQIETPPLLGQIGGGEIDGDAPRGKFQLGAENGRAHPILGLFHCRFWQTDDGEAGQAVGQVNFNSDQWGGNAQFGAGINDGE